MANPETSDRAYRRNRSSSASVVWSDRIAKHVITIGGIATLLVVLMVVLVLLANVAPLFRGTRIDPVVSIDLNPTRSAEKSVLALGMDEYSELVWMLRADHSIHVQSLVSSATMAEFAPETPLAAGQRITSVSVDSKNTELLIGYSDGSVRPVSLVFEVSYRKLLDLDPKLAESLADAPTVSDGAIYRRTAGNLVRVTQLSEVRFHDPIAALDAPIQWVDCNVRKDDSGFAESTQWNWAAATDHRVVFGTLEEKPAMFGDAVETTQQLWRSRVVESSDTGANKTVRGVMVPGRGDSVQSIDAKGEITWWSLGDNEQLEVLQTYLTITASESRPVCTAPLLGRSTWVIGGESGHVESVAISPTDNGQELLSIHHFGESGQPIRSLACSPANRIVAALTEADRLHLFHATAENEIASWPIDAEGFEAFKTGQTIALQFNPSGQSVAVYSPDRLSVWSIDAPFPEASLASYFLPIWYEGYTEPRHIWQSSTGSIEGETKFGMWPLIFGTLKATLYSMIIAAPIALLAAIYGSEFMSGAWRLRFKPLIELMASIPSVVLGFIGAMVLAPLLRDSLFWVLLSVVLTLVFFAFAAHLWMLIPSARAIPLRRYRLPLIFLVPPIAIALGWCIARPIEQWIFGTSILDWLGNSALGPWPGWFLMAILPTGLLVLWLASSSLGGWLRLHGRSGSVGREAVRRLIVFVMLCGVSVLLAMLVASLLSGMGWDARGQFLGPYQERNALLVGGILGFAIIPLVYTLADDALQSVPQHLRSASLGCGATVWQTTIRVVVPTAMSGLFSALMIGFGRAIGETMVVLMAAGNTPLMDVNPFNGYRTLSATLATELPEAARGSTHYHTLFLAALLLFLFTLVVNSCAEWVRLRFRKRAYQL